MNKGQSGFGLLTIVILVAALAGIAAASYVLMQRQNNSAPSPTQTPSQNPDIDTDARKEAIRQAQEYTADEICAKVMTPAVHNKTGVSYVFPAACVPEGWTPEESNYVSGKIKTCPDEWYDNQMPPNMPDDDYSRQYLIIKGERKEIADYDIEWIQEFCPVNQPTVVE